jgi:polyisoprenoid-binding protein YceI
MKRLKLLTVILALLVFSTPSFADVSTWKIDTDHTSAQFKVQHMVITSVRGEFPDVQGTVLVDEKDLTRSSVDAVIAAASISTNHTKRDNHLKSADFFDVEKFPTLAFKSKKVTREGEDRLRVLGDLTIRGVTKEVELLVKGPTQTIKDPWGNIRMGASASTELNRKDFGLTWNKFLETGGLVVGDEVEISIDVELIKQKN